MQAALVPNPIWSTIDVAKESSRGRLSARVIAPDIDKSLLNQIIVPVFTRLKSSRQKKKEIFLLREIFLLKACSPPNVRFSEKSKCAGREIPNNLYDDRSLDWQMKRCWIFNYSHFGPAFRANITSTLLLYRLHVSMWKQGFQSSWEQNLCSSHYMLKSYFRTARVSLGTVCSSSSYPPMTYVHDGNFNRR